MDEVRRGIVADAASACVQCRASQLGQRHIRKTDIDRLPLPVQAPGRDTFAAVAQLLVGLFGASTGGGAALIAAADRPREIAAVVSRGGRPDLAGAALSKVTTPTLLIVGGFDTPVIQMNRDAMKQMRGLVKLEVVPGATHLFEEPGTLERVAELAGDWFAHYLRPGAAARPR